MGQFLISSPGLVSVEQSRNLNETLIKTRVCQTTLFHISSLISLHSYKFVCKPTRDRFNFKPPGKVSHLRYPYWSQT